MIILDAPTRRRAAGGIGAYVATNLYEGRTLFEILGDAFVEARRDEHPDLLGALAIDEVVRTALAATRSEQLAQNRERAIDAGPIDIEVRHSPDPAGAEDRHLDAA